MAKDKDSKEKKSKKRKSTDPSVEIPDAADTSMDIDTTATRTKGDDADPLDEEDFYDSKLPAQAAFAQPLANKRLNKKVLRTVKKGKSIVFCQLRLASQAKELSRGVKEVVKALRKGAKG
jgi:hypothetical protein